MTKRCVVVGAGIIGLATAWQLKQQGFAVTVVDPQPVSGASWAAAGMLAPVAEVVWDQPGLYPLMVESGQLYRDFVTDIADAAQVSLEELGYVENGTYVCAGDGADRRYLQELMGLQHAMGMTIESVTARQVRQSEPSVGPGCVGAVSIPNDHQVDPRKLYAQLLQLIGEENLVRQYVQAVVWEGRDEDGGEVGSAEGRRVVGVQLDDGTTIEADEVLLATGTGIDSIAGLPERLRLPVRPVYGDVIRMSVPERLQPLTFRTIRGIVHGRPVYIVPRPDGSVVLGATSREDGRSGTSAEGVYQLLKDAYRLVPAILECDIEEITTKARPGSPDDIPMLGRVAEGLTISTGYFRHGILLAALGATLGAKVVSGKGDVPTSMDPWRFS